MGTSLGASQLKLGAACDDHSAMVNILLQNRFQSNELGLKNNARLIFIFLLIRLINGLSDQCDQIDTEVHTHRSVLEQIIENFLRQHIAPQLNHHTNTRLVGVVIDIGDALNFFLARQQPNLLDQLALDHLVG